MKYPRTPHLPWSPGTTADDRKLSGDWFENYRGKEIVITEKLDGENNTVTRNGVYARSHAAPTTSPWTRNMWGTDGIYWQIKNLIAEDEEVFGENLYGVHSITYEKLPSYWHIFAVNDGVNWYSWNDVCLMAELLEQRHVPELWRGIIETEEQLADLVDKFAHEPSAYGSVREGCVIRLASAFPIEDFGKSVCKWVREGHVQTDEHWTRNWKRAKLEREFNN